MTDKEYFAAPALSKSQIKNWTPYNPLAFWNQSAFNPEKAAEEYSDYLVRGKLYHMMLLQRELVHDNFEVSDEGGKSRNNKKWIVLQEQADKLIITSEENAQAVRMMDAISHHEMVRDIFTGGVIEAPFSWDDMEWGVKCKMKLDYLKNTKDGIYVIDYKTTSIDIPAYIDKGGFQFDIGFYSRGIKAKYGQPLKKFIFVFQSTNEGEEHLIRVKVADGVQLEACEIATELAVKQIVPRLKAWESAKDDTEKLKAWLPAINAETWEVSPWFDRALADNIHKGE